MVPLPKQHSSYEHSIDGLRAIAIVSILVFHAYPNLLPGGFVGVDIFFVISGYLISLNLYTQVASSIFSFKEFYARRMRRLFPALILVGLATWSIGWFLLLADEYKALGKNLIGGALFFSNVQFWSESSYFDAAAETKPLLHLWSLAVEEQFYLIWPVLLWVWSKMRWKFSFLITTLGLASFVVNVLMVGKGHTAAFYLTPFRLWEFLIGAAVACYQYSISQQPHDPIPQSSRWIHFASLCGGMILLGSVVLLHSSPLFPGWYALAPTLGTALMLWAGPQSIVNRTMLNQKPLTYIGLISYPLYLWHWPLLTYLRLSTHGQPSLIKVAGCVALTFLLSVLTYRFIERPIRFGFTNALRQRFVLPLGVGMAVVVCLGVANQLTDGFIVRFPPFMQNLVNYKYDNFDDWRITKCFLKPDQKGYDKSCIDPPALGQPLVMLWGDSLAAHIYPGLKALQDHVPFRVAQFTGSLCPPFLGWSDPERPFCSENNAEVIKAVEQNKPDVVLLSAAWIHYEDFLKPPQTVADPLRQTIALLRDKGVHKIIIIGPFPGWIETLPKSMYAFFIANRYLPSRMTFNQIDKVFVQDQKLAAIAHNLGIDYISATEALCTKDGCLTYADDNPDHLTAFDNGHMTAAGSIYFVKAVQSQLPL